MLKTNIRNIKIWKEYTIQYTSTYKALQVMFCSDIPIGYSVLVTN